MDFSNWRELVWYCAKKCPLSRQNWRAMRLSLVLILASVLQVQAYYSWAQDNVSLSFKNAPIQEVFMAIHKQTGYNFAYNESVISKAKPVSISVINVSLKEALDICFQNQPITYEVEDKVIILRKKLQPVERNSEDKIPDANIDVKGRVLNENGEPIEGVTVKVKGTGISTITKNNGEFELNNIDKNAVLVFTHVAMETEVVNLAGRHELTVTLVGKINQLSTVEILSTGYQEVKKEHSTGSFVKVTNELLNRRVSTSLLDRLEGVVSGLSLNVNNKQYGQSDISIRGKSTLFGDPNPLIVLDNFPYDGDISTINPNDVESITILKDAAAASIWGARAGNGVIVITTKKGQHNKDVKIQMNNNLTIGGKPNLYYIPQVNTSDFIDVEIYLFEKGKYNSTINNGYERISPVVSILSQKRDGLITEEQANDAINRLRNIDTRKEIDKHFYRKSIFQQHSVSINGGSERQKYYLSVGYDRNLNNDVTNSYNRYTVNANNTSLLFNSKLEVFSNIIFSSSNTQINPQNYIPFSPYEQLKDESGDHLAVVGTSNFRLRYVDTAGQGKLLDWMYRPLDEINRTISKSTNTNYTFKLGISYKIINSVKLSADFQYGSGFTENNRLYKENSYFTRNMINMYSQIDWSTGNITRAIPLGAILDRFNSFYKSYNGRLQFTYSTKLGNDHSLNAIAGYEVKQYSSENRSQRLYGYNEETALSSLVDYVTRFKYYYSNTTSTIPTNTGQSATIDRFVSYFSAASYGYKNKYFITASARKDASNLFGVKPNQKGVPLWSVGGSWIISKEPFFHVVRGIDFLKLKTSYGYNGNVDKSISAYLTAAYFGSTNTWQAVFAEIQNPPNPSLRWEKVRNINTGIEFAAVKNRFAGEIDFWIKEGVDLIGNSPVAPQSGVTVFRGNSANTRTKGMDIMIHTVNIDKAIKWSTAWLFNYITDKVTNYKVKQGTNSDIVSRNYFNPLEGFPYHSIFSYKWGGLDTLGNPTGFLGGHSSVDYAKIQASSDASELVYSGSAVPVYFGNIRNAFLWKSFEFSISISYEMGHYFRRNSLSNVDLYNGAFRQADFDKRWQKPGDELTTYVPSLIYPANASRDRFYTYSEVLIEKADFIRLQDIRFSYLIRSKQANIPSNIRLYLYANNLGLIWRANKKGIDPEFPGTTPPNPKTIAIGINVDL